jgi:hypothetical protein
MLEAQDGFVKNAVRNGSAWDVTTVSMGYLYGPLDLAIGLGGAAHISYQDRQDSRFEPDLGDAIYAVLTNGEWRVEAIFDQGHDGWDNRIVIDSQGRPHISAIDPSDFGGNGVEYYFLDDAGKWTVRDHWHWAADLQIRHLGRHRPAGSRTHHLL